MTGSRDLSGFGVPPARKSAPPAPITPPAEPAPSPAREPRAPKPSRSRDRKPPAEPAPTAPRRQATSRPAGTPRPRRATKRRINLSLPLSIADALRHYTDVQQTYYLDVIVRAHAIHAADVQRAFTPDPSAQPRLRRRRPSGRVQIALTIEPDVLASIDSDAAETGLDRSSFITELLARQLGEGTKPKR